MSTEFEQEIEQLNEQINNLQGEKQPIITLEPYSIINTAERQRIEQFFMQTSGLEPDQFAMNSFGFPPVPFPIRRKMSGKVRLAPNNVSVEYLGHPIYWIDEKLTHFDPENESADNWSIRMFFLISALGYYNSDNQWVDFLESRGFDYNSSEVHFYHQPDNPSCFADLEQYKFLTEDDLTEELSFVESSAVSALAQCAGVLRVEHARNEQNQLIAYSQALSIIGNKNVTEQNINFDSDGGYWKRQLEPLVANIVNEYERRLESRRVFEVNNQIFQVSAQITEALKSIDKYTTLLAIPQVSSAENLKDRFTAQMAYLALSNAHNEQMMSEYDFSDAINYALVDDVSQNGINTWLQRIVTAYQQAWKRLRLATVNYERQSRGKRLYKTYGEFEVGSVAEVAIVNNKEDYHQF